MSMEKHVKDIVALWVDVVATGEEVLYYYDQPLLFSKEYAVDCVIFTLLDMDEEGRLIYAASVISRENLQRVRDNTLSVYGAFKTNPVYQVVLEDFTVTKITLMKDPDSHLANPGHALSMHVEGPISDV